jgi:carboxymethylenebutenolidase
MKKIITLLMLIAAVSAIAVEKNAKQCCSTAPTKFADFSSDEEFAPNHSEPIAFNFLSESGGEMIEIPVEESIPANAFSIAGNTNKYLFVIHEWWGLNGHIKEEAEKLYKDLGGKVNVIALDLYDGKVASNREDAQKYMQEATGNMERIMAIFDAAINYAKSQNGEIELATIGWCFGGGMSMQLAIEAGELADACVIYYGMPEDKMERLKKLKAPVLGIFAKQDKWINPEVVSTFKQNMKEADKSLEVHSFDAPHAFANPSNPGHEPKLARKAYYKTLKFLRFKLGV